VHTAQQCYQKSNDKPCKVKSASQYCLIKYHQFWPMFASDHQFQSETDEQMQT